MTCLLCGREIESTRLAHQWVGGWKKSRKEGGTHALRCEEPLDIWAHDACVEKASRGIPAGQTTLV